MDLAFEVAEYFELDQKAARRVAAEVGRAVACWRVEARKLGIAKTEIDRMSSAFEHEDLKAARR